MKVLFVIRSIEYIHYYRSIIETLCERGHTVELLFDKGWSREANHEPLNDMCTTYPNLSWGWSLRRKGLWRPILFTLRELRSYRRYLLIEGQSDYYRDRWLRYVPFLLRVMLKYVPGTNALLRASLAGKFLQWIEQITPPAHNVLQDVKQRAPDIVLVTPLNQRFAEELEYLKAARVLNIPSAGSVLSWDNLTTKGLIHVLPDLLFVWNETQVEEARVHHGISREGTRIIGAPVFDQWFEELKPSRSREDFCAAHDINSKPPYLLYLGSSRNIAHNETWVVERLRQALDSNPALKHIQIVVRPHGANYGIYKDFERDGIIVAPKVGTLPNTKDAFQLSYDSMHFALGIVGINTSAMIEAMIIGKPVLAIMEEKYHKTQQEAQHFRQLLKEQALVLIRTNEDFLLEVNNLERGIDMTNEARQRFVATYICPRDRHVAAGEYAVQELELLKSRDGKD